MEHIMIIWSLRDCGNAEIVCIVTVEFTLH
jgi:hypothetical protein